MRKLPLSDRPGGHLTEAFSSLLIDVAHCEQHHSWACSPVLDKKGSSLGSKSGRQLSSVDSSWFLSVCLLEFLSCLPSVRSSDWQEQGK